MFGSSRNSHAQSRWAMCIVTLAILLMAFQNCTAQSNFRLEPTTKQTSQASSGSGSGTGTGQGYDGKPFDELQANLCADGTYLKARVMYQSQEKANLVREGCVWITPRALVPGTFALTGPDSSILSLIENSILRTFSASSSTPTPTPSPNLPANVTEASCDSNGVVAQGFSKYAHICGIKTSQDGSLLKTQVVFLSPSANAFEFTAFVACSLTEISTQKILVTAGLPGSGTNFGVSFSDRTRTMGVTFNMTLPPHPYSSYQRYSLSCSLTPGSHDFTYVSNQQFDTSGTTSITLFDVR